MSENNVKNSKFWVLFLDTKKRWKNPEEPNKNTEYCSEKPAVQKDDF
jgi:hypothetical protein